MTAEAPYCIYSHTVRDQNRLYVGERTIASVMPLQIPLPPPVQKRTLPLNMSGLNVAARSTAGAEVRWTDILGRVYKERVYRRGGEQQRCTREHVQVQERRQCGDR
jgi:hypothetical protein